MPRVTKKPLVYLALSPAAVATALTVLPRDVYAAIDAGVLPVFQIGARRRILLADVERWVRSWSQAAPRKSRKGKSHG